MRVERFLERVEIEAGARVDRNLDGLQVQSLHGLQGRMKRRSLDRDDIAGRVNACRLSVSASSAPVVMTISSIGNAAPAFR